MTTTSRWKPKSLLRFGCPEECPPKGEGACPNSSARLRCLPQFVLSAPRPEHLERQRYGSNLRQGTTRIRLRRYRPATARVFSPYLVDSLKLMEEASSKYRVLAGTSATRNPKWIACMSSSESKLKPRELRRNGTVRRSLRE